VSFPPRNSSESVDSSKHGSTPTRPTAAAPMIEPTQTWQGTTSECVSSRMCVCGYVCGCVCARDITSVHVCVRAHECECEGLFVRARACLCVRV
jgi:hypothetical protein